MQIYCSQNICSKILHFNLNWRRNTGHNHFFILRSYNLCQTNFTCRRCSYCNNKRSSFTSTTILIYSELNIRSFFIACRRCSIVLTSISIGIMIYYCRSKIGCCIICFNFSCCCCCIVAYFNNQIRNAIIVERSGKCHIFPNFRCNRILGNGHASIIHLFQTGNPSCQSRCRSCSNLDCIIIHGYIGTFTLNLKA